MMKKQINGVDQLAIKPSLSIKKGLESLAIKKTITFASENEEKSSASLSRRKSSRRKKKPSHSELMAQVPSKYLSTSTISTMAKLEIEKRFKPDEEEIKKK